MGAYCRPYMGLFLYAMATNWLGHDYGQRMSKANDWLGWIIMAAAIGYGRKNYDYNKLTTEKRPEFHYHYEQIWRLQRELGCPPIGMIL